MAGNNNDLIVVVTTIVAIIFLTASTCSVAACNTQDRKALLAFQAAFPGATMWPSTGDCCSWAHVQCDDKGRISLLKMDGDYEGLLNGSLPAALGDLTALEYLSLFSMPDLVGPIPPQLSRLKNLKRLSFPGCQLSGPVPSFLSLMPALEDIDLRYNMFTGTIPPALGDLEYLNTLYLDENQLTGTIPSTLFSRAKKGDISVGLSSNKLTGTIPRSFANVNFASFDVSHNQLSEDASFLLGRNKKMSWLTLYNNKFAFDLTNVKYPLTLTTLDISHNKIYGSISNQITELPNLLSLDVSNNLLCGKIPSGGHVPNITSLFAHNKCLCGTPLPPCK